MKKFLLSSTLFLISFIGFSQTKGISYQAVIIDPNPIQIPGSDITAQPYVSKEVWIRFGIYAGTTLQYEELHKTKTDEFGLVNLVIGAGVNTGRAGTFTSLSWDGITKSILTNVSFDQGGRYTEVSNQKLNYVPYTLLAETAVKLSGVLPISSGGTGATNAIAARTNLGLGNVDNTSDADKPVSTATLAILDTKEAIANKSTNIIADSASSVKYPSVKAIKAYVDSRTSSANNANLAAKATALETPRTINGVPFDGTANITIPVGVTPPDASTTTKGLVQLAGDLTGTAAAPTIAANSITTAKIIDGAVTTGKLAAGAVNTAQVADGAITNAKITSVAGSKVTGDIAGNAATATLATTATSANTATKLTTARTINGTPFDGTSDITITTNASTLSGTIGILNGGTGASTAAGARTNLGLVIGTDVLAQRTFGTAANSAATDFVAATEKGANNGVATLGNNGKIPSTQIPAISFQNVNVVNSDATMTAIAGAQVGSIAIRTDNNNNYVLSALPASTLSNWIALATPLYVSTVNGYAGPNVVLTTNDVAEGTTNKYFTDARVRNAISATAPLNFNTTSGVLSMTAASATSNGYLSSADFTTFNNKQTALTAGVDYVTPAGNITGNAANVTGIVSIANGGTGTSTAAGALVTLGAEASSNKSNDILLDGSSTTKFPTFKAIKDYVDQQSANAGVADNSITSAKINGNLAVLKGGTGASTAAGARTNLGLVIGTDVMAANFTTTLTGDVAGSGNGSFATTVNSVGGVSSSTIATLPTNVSANTASITANTNSIATLNTNVAANTASITANANSIATLNTNVSANTASITANTTSIATNATAITSEATTARAAELTLTNSVNANTASITANTNAIAANTTSITANSTEIATINTNLALKAPLASPAFTGVPTAPTPATSDNSTKVATTEYVKASITAASAGLSTIGAISATPNSRGATISGTTELILTPADASNGGVVTTGAQTFAGAKTFTNTVTFGTDITVNGLTLGGSTTYGNTALGYLALKQVQASSYNAGSWNTAIGHASMYGNTTGNFNTAIGRSALTNNTTGSYNTTVGFHSGSSLRTISTAFPTENTFIGNSSGAGITTGSYNTILGSQTYSIVSGAQVGIGITTGSNNTIIGGRIFGLAPTLSNNIILADGAGNIRAQYNGTTGWTLGTIVSGTWSGTTIGSNVGGAGSVNGLMKADGSGVVSAAVAGTDYLSPSGSAALLTNFPTLNQSTTGNAATATALATGRTINGVAFDGSANITIAADANTLTGTTLASNITASSLTSVGTITSGIWSATTIDIAKGGTGATTAAAALTNLGAQSVDNMSTNITTDAASITRYPSVKLIKDYVDTRVASAGVSDGSITNVKLANSTTILGSTTMTLGGTVSSVTGLTSLEATNLTGTLSGTATALATGRTISTTGDVTYTSGAFDGTSNVTGSATLTNTTVTAGNYGSSTAIPTFTVDSKGRLTAASTVGITAGVSTLAYSTTGASNGGTISGTTLTLTAADASNPGLISTGTQTIAGAKTFTNTATFNTDISVNGLTVGRGAGAVASNAAFGATALNANTSGNFNVAVGSEALQRNTGGSVNVALGAATIDYLTSGNNNTAVGGFAGRNYGPNGGATGNNTTMNNGILLGYDARPLASGGTDEVVIGMRAIGHGSNTVTLGNSSNTKTFLTGDLSLTGNITSGIWSATEVAVAKGGTGATTAAGARTNLGLVIGTDVMAANFTTTLTGDVTGAGNGSFATTLAASGVTSGTYGSSTAIPTFTVDTKGRITSASSVAITAGVSTLAYSTTGSSNGGTISGTTLTLTAADASNPGLISTGAQTIAGAKTFSSDVTATNFLGNATTATTASNITATSNTTLTSLANLATVGTITSGVWSGTVISSNKGGAGSVSGLLKANGSGVVSAAVAGTDYQAPLTAGTSFIAPNAAITAATKTKITYDAFGLVTAGADATTADIAPSTNRNYVTDAQAGVISNTSGTNTGDETASTIKTKLGIATLSGSNTGDQTITLTGDVTGTGTGSFAATLTNTTVTAAAYGSSTAIPTFTVDSKGRLTAASTASIVADAGTLTGTSLASTVTGSSLTSVGTITTGVWSGTTISIAKGGTGATTKAAGFDALSPMTTSGDIIYGGASGTGTRLAKGTDGQVLTLASGIPSWEAISAVTSLGTFTTTAYTAGGTINGSTLTLSAADGTKPGLVSTVAQTIAGAKTFSADIFTNNDVRVGKGVAGNTSNTVVGKLALGGTSTVTNENVFNTAIGISAMQNSTGTGSYNTAVGANSAFFNNSGSHNTYLGYQTGYSTTSGTKNVAIGSGALYGSTTGNYLTGEGNNAIGFEAMKDISTTASDNIAIGLSAGTKLTTGTKNIFIGSLAGKSISTGSSANTTGLNSVLIGYDVRPLANADDNEIVISGYNGTAGTVGLGSNSTLIGSTTTQKSQIYGALTVIPNTATGAGNSSTIAAQNGGTNLAGGGLILRAGNGNGTGNGGDINLYPGTTGTGTAGRVIVNSGDMTVNTITIGLGKNNISTNTALGYQTLNAVPSGGGGFNTAIGYQALLVNTSGSGNVALGHGSLANNTTSSDNTAIGFHALNSLNNAASSSANVAVGSTALSNGQFIMYNTAVGNGALNRANGVSGTPSTYNTALGFNALNKNTTGNNNVGIGSNALVNITTTSNNTAIGVDAGSYFSNVSNSNTTSTNGVFLGFKAWPSADGLTNEIVIGANSNGNGSNTTTIGNGSTLRSIIYGSTSLSNLPANATSGSHGGDFILTAQNGTGTNRNGGNISLTPGTATGSGAAGRVNINSVINVVAGTATASTNGLSSTITAQNAGTGNQNGGDINLTPGTATGTGTAGVVKIDGRVQITGGNPGAGEVLMSDANGLATWSYSIGSTVVTSTTTYAITLAEAYVFYNGSAAGAFTIPDPSATNAGKEITIKNKTAFGITITPASTGKIYIDSANTAVNSVSIGIEASNNWIKLVSDGSQWNVIRALF